VAERLLADDLTLEQLGAFLGLLAWMHRRWALERPASAAQANTARVPPGDLLTITRAQTLEEARARLEAIRARFELGVKLRGDFTEITWPKLAKYQGWSFPNRAPRRKSSPEVLFNTAERIPLSSPPLPSSGGFSSSVETSTSSLRTEHDAHAENAENATERRYVPVGETPTNGAKADRSRGLESALPAYLPGRDFPVAERAVRWANVLGQEPGTVAEKVAYLTRELPLIEAEALASLGAGHRTRENARAKVRALVIRFWRNEVAKQGRGDPARKSLSSLEKAARRVAQEPER
jgi:hypothetical protein